MSHRLPIYLIVTLLVAGLFCSCNDDSVISSTAPNYVNCEVSSFSLAKNDSVLVRLDSVYFAIDLMNASIYNADSLPVGTKISRLKVNVGTESAREVNITYRVVGQERDTTVNLLDHPNDSVNFADGPARLEIVSYNGQARRTYQVKVNVHKVAPDTLYWSETAMRPLPTSLAAPTAQKTVEYKDDILCFTTDGTASAMATVTEPFTMTYTAQSVNLPAGVEMNSICATADGLYCLASGQLYGSTDGVTWTGLGEQFYSLYGTYEDKVLGVKMKDGEYLHATYPAGNETVVPDKCPVSGTSQMVNFTSKWNTTPTAILVGGKDKTGARVSDAWAYDGSNWAKISNSPLPYAMDGVVLFPYNTPRVNRNNWRVTDQSALVAFGGIRAGEQGAVACDTVYVSRDFGITWTKADATLQLPRTIKNYAGAQVYVEPQTLGVTPADTDDSAWCSLGASHLPVWAMGQPVGIRASRAIAPITEWSCPFIYLFGGTAPDGTLENTVRRGVINRYTFKPIY